jgi:uncharacterized protein (DUF58 family)
MDTSEILKKVRRIEIKTKGLSKNIFAGEYHSAFKGRGMAFSEVREYQYGDDVRSIDWNVTARFNHPYVKIFEEERELTIMLLIDVSASGNFGTIKSLKKELATEIAAVLAFSTIQNNDKVGAIFFSDKIEMFIPPQKGRKHTLRIIRETLDFKPQSKGTDLNLALKYLNNIIKKRCTAFILSDFLDNGFSDAIKLANKKHDIIALQLYDQHDEFLPAVGDLMVKNAETGSEMWIDTSSARYQKAYIKWWIEHNKFIDDVFMRSGVDFVKLRTDLDYVKPLLQLFKRR